MTKLTFIYGLLLITLLGGCASMDRQDCLDADWQRVGYEAGQAGEQDQADAYAKRAEVCARHGSTADVEAFDIGYAQGIERFCENANAVKLGERGAKRVISQEICPPDQYPDFEIAFKAGYKLHQLRTRVEEDQHKLQQLANQENRLHRSREILGQQLQSGQLNEQDARRAQSQIKDLGQQMGRVQSRIYRQRNRLIQSIEAAETYAKLLKIEYGDDRG